MRQKVLAAAAAGAVTTAVLIVWRGFFPQHAVIVGLGAAALVYSTWRTVERMRGG